MVGPHLLPRQMIEAPDGQGTITVVTFLPSISSAGTAAASPCARR